MKNLILVFIVFITTLSFFSCESKSFHANAEEIAIINEMSCWDSYEKLLLEVEHDQKENQKTAIEKEIQKEREKNMTLGERYAYMDAWMPYISESEKKGRESLYNNIEFLNIIRNDSLFEELREERKMLAKSLEPFKEKVLFLLEI